ncbi:MAG: peroxiredoxin, partial [Bacteroidota bacterium]
MSKLSVGDQAPDFSLPNQDREVVSLSDYKGKKHLVVYFYPKDETPGCVKEACGFRDSYEAFTEAGAEVIGISADGATSHSKFIRNRNLPFQLLSDKDLSVAEEFGVKKSLFGLFPG